jgi:citrate lyase subunit beta / citryl-CoA lyase
MHPNDVLLGAQAASLQLPVVDHYSGVEVRMRKSLQLQAEMAQEFGACVFDATLDCEDGAPVGGEADHAALVCGLVREAVDAATRARATKPRIAVRVHPVDHPAFEADIAQIVGQVGSDLCHIMIPKVESVADVQRACKAIDDASAAAAIATATTNKHAETRALPLPIQVLLESPTAIHHAFDIAAHPRVQSMSFGLMDFVSSHGGAIPASGMSAAGQFSHPLVVRAKLALASACHAHGKVPSHCVVTEFADAAAMMQAARRAAQEFGYTRMWSIHPNQIRPILQAMAPSEAEIAQATEIIVAAVAVNWAPIQHDKQLHDRASYRYFWQLLCRAHATGLRLAPEVALYF